MEVPASPRDEDLPSPNESDYDDARDTINLKAQYTKHWLASVLPFNLRKQYEENLADLLKTSPHEEIYEFTWYGKVRKGKSVKNVELSGLDPKSYGRVRAWLEEDGLLPFADITEENYGLKNIMIDLLPFILGGIAL